MAKWAAYVKAQAEPSKDPSVTSKVYNIISLEISETELAQQVVPPRLVREIDWVDNFWNFGSGGKNGAMAIELAKQAAARGEGAKDVNGSVEKDLAHKGPTGEGSSLAVGHGRTKMVKDWPKVQLYCLVCTSLHRSYSTLIDTRWE
jgi:F-box/leucine-rich repeat protein 10/11